MTGAGCCLATRMCRLSSDARSSPRVAACLRGNKCHKNAVHILLVVIFL